MTSKGQRHFIVIVEIVESEVLLINYFVLKHECIEVHS